MLVGFIHLRIVRFTPKRPPPASPKPVKCDLTSQLIIYLIKYSTVREKLLCSRFPAAKIPDIRHVNVFDNPFTIGRDFLNVP